MDQSLLLLVLMSVSSLTVSHEYHFIDEKRTWSEAQTFCRKHYTDLASLFTTTDLSRLCAGGGRCTDAWIGLNKQTNNKKTWHWSLPGVEYKEREANWAQGEAQDNSGTENCVFIKNDTTWGDLTCSGTGNAKYHICYDETSSSFILIQEPKRTWLEAQSYCRQHHTDLVSGLDQLQNQTLIDRVKQQSVDGSVKWWIGLFRDTWSWSDGSKSSFRNWHVNEQDVVFGLNSQQRNQKRNCAKVGDQNKWKTADCTETNTFVCHEKLLILIEENKTWEEALYYCRENHRDLAWMTNDHEQRMVQKRAEKAHSELVWVGLFYYCFLETWLWPNGEFLGNYEKWKDKKMDDFCGFSGAMEKGGGEWIKRRSNERFNFVCIV